MPKITYVYIDSFNFYYGSLKRVPNAKWLNVETWLTTLLPKGQYDIRKIKFFTANVSAVPHDLQKPIRQAIYFRALQTLPTVEIIKGKFKSKNINVLINQNVKMTARVPEEKGTDVNLAVHVVNDAHLKLFDTAVVISNDSDLAEAVAICGGVLKKEVWVVNPCLGIPANKTLTKHAAQIRNVREKALRANQFNPHLTDSIGSFSKPATW